VVQVFGDDAARIEKRPLRHHKLNAVFRAVQPVLGVIPLEARLSHMANVPYSGMAEQ
jgi:hypothetical protein